MSDTPQWTFAAQHVDWNQYELEQLWGLLRDEDGRVNWIQDAAWQRMAGLCQEQADVLDKALTQLLQQWPAHPGSASSEFARQVHRLIGSMRESAEAAVVNREALRTVSSALASARAHVADLVDQAQRYAGAEQQMLEITRSQTPWYPGRPEPTTSVTQPQRPPDNWKATLDQQAREIMTQAEALVGEQAMRMRKPKRYVVSPSDIELQHPAGGPSVISNVSYSLNAPGSKVGPFPPYNSLTHIYHSEPDRSVSTIDDSGPILAGSSASTVPAWQWPSDVAGAVSDYGSSPGAAATPLGGVLMPGALNPRVGSQVQVNTATGSRRSGFGAGAGERAFASDRGANGGLMPSVASPASACPEVGGSGVRPAGRVAGFGRRRRVDDPHDPWAVPQGGPAVLQPQTPASEFDPGPGVIGLDR